MVTTDSPSPSPPTEPNTTPAVPESDVSTSPQPDSFFDLLIKSVFEPGANAGVVMAMNLSFFLLILTLFALAAVTRWNFHVLMLLGISTILWAAMAWFVMELTRVQGRPDNMPPTDADLLAGPDEKTSESKKDQ